MPFELIFFPHLPGPQRLSWSVISRLAVINGPVELDYFASVCIPLDLLSLNLICPSSSLEQSFSERHLVFPWSQNILELPANLPTSLLPYRLGCSATLLVGERKQPSSSPSHWAHAKSLGSHRRSSCCCSSSPCEYARFPKCRHVGSCCSINYAHIIWAFPVTLQLHCSGSHLIVTGATLVPIHKGGKIYLLMLLIGVAFCSE